MKELLKALAKAKEQIQPIVKGETNPFFKNKYFDINALLLQLEPILSEHGLLLLQPILEGANGASIVTSRIYHVDSGEYVQSSMTLPTLQDSQKMGSAVTYYRRYTVQSLLALQSEDDDANLANKPAPVKKATTAPAKPPVKKDKVSYNEEMAKGAVSAGTTLAQFKKHVKMSPDEEKQYELLENGAGKS